MKYTKICTLLLLWGLFVACGSKQTEGKIVTVTIEPQRFFAEKIAGDKFTVNCIVPVGQSPETYDSTPKQMVQVGKSDAYLRIGSIGFEQVWMEKIQENNPDLTVIAHTEGMSFVEGEETCTHHHEHAHEHHHPAGGVDPHIWSSIEGAKVVAWNTLNAFILLDKENTAYYWKNYTTLLAEIEQTADQIKQILEPLESRSFIIYHPALTYFAHEFGLKQLCIEMDGKEPSPVLLKELIKTAKEHGVKVVFIQQEFDQKNAELIAKETGCRLVVINPLDYQWSKELIHIAKALVDEQAD